MTEEVSGQNRVLSGLVITLLCALSMITAVSVDIMLPAAGIIAVEYGAPQKMGGMLVGVYFLGFAAGQLVCGLASDAIGRRPVLLWSTAAFTVASIGCVFADSLGVLLALRFIQGLAGGAPVVARAVVRDLGTGPSITKLLALLMATVSIGPLLAPVLGSALIVLFDWRACFLALALGGGVLWLGTLIFFEETIVNKRSERFSLKFVAYGSRTLMRTREFLVGSGIAVLTFGGYSSLLALGAVLTDEAYGLSPASFGAIFAIAAAFAGIGSLSVRSLIDRLGDDRTQDLAVLILAAATVTHMFFMVMGLSLPVFWAGICLYVFAMGFVQPVGTALALRPAGAMPGFAASLMGAVSMLAGFVGGTMATGLYSGDHRAISSTMALFGTLAVGIYLAGRFIPAREDFSDEP